MSAKDAGRTRPALPFLSQATADRGIVLAATGEKYNILARRAARGLRRVMPDVPIDLFSDNPPDDPVFDQIHKLDHGFFRPKMEAIRRSRFERTLIMDADILVIADISDVFDVLDDYDMAGVHALLRSRAMMRVKGRRPPRWYPVVNSGVLLVRKNARTLALCQTWEQSLRDADANLDQPYLRKALYESDLKFLSLPGEYNLIHLSALRNWVSDRGAPLVLHSRRLHQSEDPGDPATPFSLVETVGPERAEIVEKLLASDWTLKGKRHLLNL